MGELSQALGKAFIVAALIPALIFITLNQLFVLPLLPPQAVEQFSQIAFPDLGISGAAYVLLAIVVGAILMALNTQIIQFYEGILPLEKFILRPLLSRCRDKHRQLYRDLSALKRECATTKPGRAKDSLAIAIERKHQEIFAGGNADGCRIPYDEKRLRPTRLGNVWAVIEEYSDYRYGMDGMTFWTRLLGVIPSEYAQQIGDEKTTVDFLLNLSLLSAVFGLEFLALSGYYAAPGYALIGLVSFALYYLLYRSSVAATQTLGELIKSCFDLYRGKLRESFGLPEPKSIEEERAMWYGLANYIVAGEAFYYPKAAMEAVTQGADGTAVEEPDRQGMIDILREQLSLHRKNLFRLESRAAYYGMNVPLDILNGIDHEKEKVEEVKKRLAELGEDA